MRGEAPGKSKTQEYSSTLREANPKLSIRLGRNPGVGGGQAIIQVYETLVARPIEGPDFIPSLATEVPTQENGLISEDGLTYTFPIREGVVFHDGTDLTADDVKFSWDRVVTMNLPEGGASLITEIVDETRCR